MQRFVSDLCFATAIVHQQVHGADGQSYHGDSLLITTFVLLIVMLYSSTIQVFGTQQACFAVLCSIQPWELL